VLGPAESTEIPMGKDSQEAKEEPYGVDISTIAKVIYIRFIYHKNVADTYHHTILIDGETDMNIVLMNV
jgi:hypothetical protein